MKTLKTFSITCAAAALLLPATTLANQQAPCSSTLLSSGVIEPRVELARLANALEEGVVQVLDHSDILAVRGSHPFALHWTSHALKLDELKTSINTTSKTWCRLAALPDISGAAGTDQFRKNLAGVAAKTDAAITLLQQNRLAHMGFQYQKTILEIREHARSLNADAVGLVQVARSKQRGNSLEARSQSPVATE